MKRNKTREERRLATQFKLALIAGAIMWLFILLLFLGSIRPKGSAAIGATVATQGEEGTTHPEHITLEENVNENR